MARANGKDRGLYEKVKGSNEWWICYFTAEGQKRREKIGTKSQARSAYQLRKAAILKGEKLPELTKARAFSFAELAKDALDWSKKNKASWKDDEERLRPFIKEFGHRSADTLETAEFTRFLNRLQEERGLAGATINRYRAVLQMAYREGKEIGTVKNNPARDIRPRKNAENVIRFLSNDEERRLVAAIMEPQFLTEFYFALLTGLRRSNQYGLKWTEVDFENRTAYIGKTKNGDERYVQLHSSLLPMLQALPRHSEYVFGRPLAQKGDYNLTWFEDACKRAGVKNFRWHDIRHTFATRLVVSGQDLKRVKEAMGHKTIAMTDRYSHLEQRHVREAIDTLAPVTLEAQPKEAVN